MLDALDFESIQGYFYNLQVKGKNFTHIMYPTSLEATEPVSEPATQMAVELINIQYSKRDYCKSSIIFQVKTTTNKS